MHEQELTPDRLLAAYANGYFPMAINADDPELYWFSPEERGVLPLDTFNIPRGLRRAMKQRPYSITVDQAFAQVIRSCGAKTETREETWINEPIIALYTQLHQMGHAHSVEVWMEEGTTSPSSLAGEGGADTATLSSTTARTSRVVPPAQAAAQRVGVWGALPPIKQPQLIGGLYGVSLGGAFFGESMFSRAPDASKIALVALVAILREAGYSLLDTQYVNDHLKQFGVLAVPKVDYTIKLEKALSASPSPSSRFSTASVRKGFASASSLSETFAS